MGLLQNLKEATEQAKQNKETKDNLRKEMIVTTAFTLDEPFETIGLVTATVQCTATDFTKVVDKLKSNAAAKGADAIIGFHAMQVLSPLKWLDQTAYGTAVRYKKETTGD